VTLDPDTYRCPTHGTDVTTLVQRELDSIGDVANVKFAFALPGMRRHREPQSQHFAVIVSCPGDSTPHPLTCMGTFTP
jgi:hypothetical protein